MHTFLIGLSLFGKVDANKMYRGKKQPYKEAFARMKDLKVISTGKTCSRPYCICYCKRQVFVVEILWNGEPYHS